MSTHYKHSHEVPTEVLAKRLVELSDVIGQPGEERDRELTRRIPAELDRDADLVLSEAAQRMLKMEAERDALAAHVERLKEHIENVSNLSPTAWGVRGLKLISESPSSSLARLIAEKQAEVLQDLYNQYQGVGMIRRGALLDKAIEVQQEAEELAND